jgi:hypothetical protein
MFQPPPSGAPQPGRVGAWALGDDYASSGWVRRAQAQAEVSYLVGLDLGQRQDPSAAVVIQRQDFPTQDRQCQYGVVGIRRWLGQSYVEVVAAVVSLLAKLPAPRLVVDGTGCGAACVDLLRQEGVTSLTPVLITGRAFGELGQRLAALREGRTGERRLLPRLLRAVQDRRRRAVGAGAARGDEEFQSKTIRHWARVLRGVAKPGP